MTNEELKNILRTDISKRDYEFSDETVIRTAEFIQKAHAGVFDKMGEPYYTHPYRVCQLVKERFGDSPINTPGQINYACVLALLHDVVEDTAYTPDDIVSELHLDYNQANELKEGLEYITHDKTADRYSAYIKKIAEGPLIYPVWVKYCDLLDNSSLDRVIVSNDSIFLTGEDTNRLNRYLISIRILRQRLEDKTGNFKCDDSQVNMINNFCTPGERKRVEEASR